MKSLLLFLLLLPVFASGQVIETIVGNGISGYNGDGETAISAELNGPYNVKFDRGGNMYIVDQTNGIVRKITADIIATIVGNITTSSLCGYTGDGGPATAAEMCNPADIAFDIAGNLYIADGNGAIRKVNTSGIISTVAGGGTAGLGDGGPATAAELSDPIGLVFDKAGNLYFSDNADHRVRKIDNTGVITTVAGTGVSGYSGDNGPATNAKMVYPGFINISPSGDIYIADYDNHRIRKIDNAGIITTVAGTGAIGYTGDNEPATSATLFSPYEVIFDNAGNYFISDWGSNTIRKVDAAGIITTVAGNGTIGFSGDNGPATAAQLNNPMCSAIDAYGNLYIADYGNNRIRRIVYNETAINTINKTPNNISIYPNPSQNELTIKSSTAIESVEVVNMVGQVVASKSSKEKEVLLDIRSLPAGVYFVKVNGPDGYRDGGRFLKE